MSREDNTQTDVCGNFSELQDFREISGKSGKKLNRQRHAVRGSSRSDKESRLSNDVVYENSWPCFDDTCATRTKPTPGSPKKRQAKSGAQAGDALQEPSEEAEGEHPE